MSYDWNFVAEVWAAFFAGKISMLARDRILAPRREALAAVRSK